MQLMPEDPDQSGKVDLYDQIWEEMIYLRKIFLMNTP